MLVHVGAPTVSVAELTINYRTPAEIMTVAARVLELAAAGVSPPQSVRSTGAEPVVLSVDEASVPVECVRAAREFAARLPEGKVAIVAPEPLVESVARELGIDIAHLDAAALLDAQVTVLAVDDARGLEFDAVVVAEPQQIAEVSPGGLRALYVALTRPTQSLVIVSSRLAESLAMALRPSPARSVS
jgi:DNA helicase IV